MGREIVYCGDCGTSLREDDFFKGRARETEHRPFCIACRPAPVVEPVALRKKPSSSSHAKIGTTRRTAAPRDTSRAPFIAAAVAVLVLLALAGALARPAPALRTPSTAAVAPPPEPGPGAALEPLLSEIRGIRQRDPDYVRADEVRSLFRKAAEIAGPRRSEVETQLTDYERALAAPRSLPRRLRP